MQEYNISFKHVISGNELPKSKERLYKSLVSDLNSAKDIIINEFDNSDITVELQITWGSKDE